jgi:hypothetical protein
MTVIDLPVNVASLVFAVDLYCVVNVCDPALNPVMTNVAPPEIAAPSAVVAPEAFGLVTDTDRASEAATAPVPVTRKLMNAD